MADQSTSSRDRLQSVVTELPIAHKVVIGASAAVVVLAGVLFFGWISSPSYSVLAADITDSDLSDITLELDSLGVEYRVEAAGDRVMVPRSELSVARAGLAAAGISISKDTTGRAGFELLDDQGLAISTNLERINFQRALEGELARTLRGIDRINDATVHLVLPDDRLFGDPGNAEASVIIDVPSDFNLAETDAVANLVAGAVENLAVGSVTIIDVQGRTLLAPESSQDAGALGGRNILRTIDFENRLEEDITRLLLSAGSGDRASVMVRAELSYDEVAERTESFDQTNQIPIREQVISETFTGPGSAAPGGIAGVDGANPDADGDGAVAYDRNENTTEFGVNSTVTNLVRAAGDIESLHVGVVVDDGTLTGASVVDAQVLSDLIGASIGLDQERGDTLIVTAVPFKVIEIVEGAESSSLLTQEALPTSSPLDLIPQVVGALVMLIVAGVLISMLRKNAASPDAAPTPALPPGSPAAPGGTPTTQEGTPAAEIGPPVRSDVLDLVQRQPEDIATLLRGWLTTQ